MGSDFIKLPSGRQHVMRAPPQDTRTWQVKLDASCALLASTRTNKPNRCATSARPVNTRRRRVITAFRAQLVCTTMTQIQQHPAQAATLDSMQKRRLRNAWTAAWVSMTGTATQARLAYCVSQANISLLRSKLAALVALPDSFKTKSGSVSAKAVARTVLSTPTVLARGHHVTLSASRCSRSTLAKKATESHVKHGMVLRQSVHLGRMLALRT